jgi:hypothetical protein
MIVDYSTTRPTMASLKAAGVTAVGRYIGWDSVAGYKSIGKNLSVAEAKELLSAKISIFLAFEYAANAAVNGASQGDADGDLATTQLKELGAPDNMAVYCAVDLPDYAPKLADTPANARAKLGPVGDYFAAIKAQKPKYEIGVYGGYYAAKRCLDAGLATKAWQAIAWSGGQIDSRAVLFQNLATALVPGGDVDIRENAKLVADYGQWPRPAATKSNTQEDDMSSGYPLVLDNLEAVAYVLPIPSGTAKVTLYADPLGLPDPVIRIGFGPTWSKVEASPTWDTPSVIEVPSSAQRITVSRIDTGKVPVTLDFS